MKKKWWIPVVIIAVVVAASIEIYFMTGGKLFSENEPEGFVITSGRIEGRVTDISSKLAGRVNQLHADEGEMVRKGQVLVSLSTAELEAQKREAKAHLKLWQTRRRQAELDLELTANEVGSGLEEAQAKVGVAEANLQRAQASSNQAKVDFDRSEGLFKDGAISRSAYDRSKLAYTVAEKELEVARKTKQEAQTYLNLARSRSLAVELKRSAVEEAREMIEAAKASLELIDVNLEESTIISPLDGVVLERIVETGEVIQPGTPLYTVVNPDDLYLKIYIGNDVMSTIKVGDTARIFPDGLDDRYFEAEVVLINQQAEFTPKNVETKKQRMNLVFEVKLGNIQNPDRLVKVGMSAEAFIRIDDSAAWDVVKR